MERGTPVYLVRGGLPQAAKEAIEIGKGVDYLTGVVVNPRGSRDSDGCQDYDILSVSINDHVAPYLYGDDHLTPIPPDEQELFAETLERLRKEL